MCYRKAENQRSSFRLLAVMLNINHEPAQKNTQRFSLTTPRGIYRIFLKGDKRNGAASKVRASFCLKMDSPCSEREFNRSQLLCLSKVRPLPASDTALPSVSCCCQWADLAAGRCTATSSFPQRPHFQLSDAFSQLEAEKGVIKTITQVSFYFIGDFSFPFFSTKKKQTVAGDFLWYITQTAAVTTRENLQWIVAATSSFSTRFFRQLTVEWKHKNTHGEKLF